MSKDLNLEEMKKRDNIPDKAKINGYLIYTINDRKIYEYIALQEKDKIAWVPFPMMSKKHKTKEDAEKGMKNYIKNWNKHKVDICIAWDNNMISPYNVTDIELLKVVNNVYQHL